MRKLLVLIALLSTFVLGLALVAADEPQPGTPEDNACNPGGVLYREANQDGCPSQWHWKAGWFLARFLTGEISRQNFPKEFESVLPPLPKTDAAAAPATLTICHPHAYDLTLIICVSSNSTATQSRDGGSSISDYGLLIASTDFHDCPATYNGYPYSGYWSSPNSTLQAKFNFTPAELTALGTPTGILCWYDARK